MDVDADRLVRPPPFSHQRNNFSRRVVRLVGAQGRVEKDLGRSEREPSAVQAAAREKDPGVRHIEEVGAKQLAGGAGRADRPEGARHGIIDLGDRDDLAAARPARDQHPPVVKQLHAEVSATGRAHQRGQECEGVYGRVVDLSRVEVQILRALAARHEDRGVQQQGCARQRARHVERAPGADRAADRIVELCRIQSAQRIRATDNQQPAVVQ